MTERYYNINNIVKFKIFDEQLFKIKLNNIYDAYRNYEVNKKIEDIDFSVHLGKFKPSNENCNIINNKYFIKEDYFYCKEDYFKFAKWEFEIYGFEKDKTMVNISSNFVGYMFMSGFIIDFLIHYKLNDKGYSIIHASCISKNDKGILFAARSGGGKTTLAMAFIKRGFNILGDNFIILYQGDVISYFSHLNIFKYNFVPIIKNKIGLKIKFTIYLKEFLYKLTSGYFKIFTKINPKDIFPELIIEKSKLHTIFILLPKKELKIEKIDKITLCRQMVMNQKLDTLIFLNYILEYSYVCPTGKLSMHWIRYEDNLINNLIYTSFYQVEVPKKYDTDIFERMYDFVNKEIYSKGKI